MHELLGTYISNRTGLNPEELQRILSRFQLIKTEKNQFLLRKGEICRHYYFVNSGILRLFTFNEYGEETTRYFAFEGAFGTALPSFIEQSPAFEYIQVLEPTELLKISHQDFFELVQLSPAFGLIYRKILEISFIEAQKRTYLFQGYPAEEKLNWVLHRYPKIFTRVSNKIIASFIGIKPATLSRLKSKMRKNELGLPKM